MMDRLRVYMLLDYRAHNPYQQLLRQALPDHGADFAFPSGYRLGLPVTRGFVSDIDTPNEAILHLHWPETYLAGAFPWATMMNADRLWLHIG